MLKVGDLVIWKGGWGYIDHLYEGKDTNRACSIAWGKSRRPITAWMDVVREAMEVEVKTGIWLTKNELEAILALTEPNAQIELLKTYAKRYRISQPRILGFGLTDSGEIVYTQVIAK